MQNSYPCPPASSASVLATKPSGLTSKAIQYNISIHYTCDKQVLWESAGAFFPLDNSLVSERKSHSLNLWPCKSQLLALGIGVN